jgi:plastocyanin
MVISGRRRFAAALTMVAVVSLTACTTQPSINRRPHSGSASASTVAGVQQITVTAGSTYRFDPSTISVHPGQVKVILENVGSGAPHDWSLLALPGAQTSQIGAGASASVTFTAPSPGTYTFVCTIHEKQGQTGTLVVTNP